VSFSYVSYLSCLFRPMARISWTFSSFSPHWNILSTSLPRGFSDILDRQFCLQPPLKTESGPYVPLRLPFCPSSLRDLWPLLPFLFFFFERGPMGGPVPSLCFFLPLYVFWSEHAGETFRFFSWSVFPSLVVSRFLRGCPFRSRPRVENFGHSPLLSSVG